MDEDYYFKIDEDELSEDRVFVLIIYDIMSAKEKEAAAKQTFTFLAPLTNEQSCEAGRKSAKRGFVSIGEIKSEL